MQYCLQMSLVWVLYTLIFVFLLLISFMFSSCFFKSHIILFIFLIYSRIAYISSIVSLYFKSVNVFYLVGVIFFIGGKIQVKNYILTNIFSYMYTSNIILNYFFYQIFETCEEQLKNYISISTIYIYMYNNNNYFIVNICYLTLIKLNQFLIFFLLYVKT